MATRGAILAPRVAVEEIKEIRIFIALKQSHDRIILFPAKFFTDCSKLFAAH